MPVCSPRPFLGAELLAAGMAGTCRQGCDLRRGRGSQALPGFTDLSPPKAPWGRGSAARCCGL